MNSGKYTRRTFLTAASTATAMAAMGTETGVGSGVDPALADAGGQTDVVIRLERVPRQSEQGRDGAIESVRTHAARTQQELSDTLSETSGVDLGRQFWLANAVLATVDVDTVALETLAELEQVERIHSPELPGRTRRANPNATAVSQDGRDVFEERDVSWAVELVNAPAVWEHYDARGEGARICIIDTGVDAAHPDIDLDGWAEFDEQGQRVDSEPNEPDPSTVPLAGHGTGMSSVATGGDASGMQVGVAPEAELYVAGFEGYNFPAVMAGLEWAVENDADVVSMSFTMDGQWATVIEPFQNAVDAGTLPITVSEWPLPFTFNATTPAVLTTGSLDKHLEARKGANGGFVRWDRALRDIDTPEWWPAESFSPDVTLAGSEVPNAVPLDTGSYGGDVIDESSYGPDRNWATMPGVSNTPPALAGVIALLLSVTDEQPSLAEIRESVRETAVQPYESTLPVPNDRFAHGIPHAARLVREFVDPERTITGTVTDDSGDPVESATVVTESGSETTADSDGSFELSIPEGSDTVTARTLGYEPVERSLEAGQSTVELSLNSRIEPQLDIPREYPTRVDPGATLTVGVNVEHANSARVNLESEGRRVGADDIELLIDGTSTRPGDTVDFPIETETLSVEVRFDDDARGVVNLTVDFANVDDGVITASQQLDSIHVHEQPLRVSETESLQGSLMAAAPDTTVELAGEEWTIETAPANMNTPEGLLNPNNRLVYTHPVLRPAQDDPVGLLVDRPLTLTAADGYDPTISVRDDTDSDRSVGLRVAASYATISAIELDAGGAGSGIHVLNGVGVDIDNVTVSNAGDAIRSELTLSLLVRSCDLTGTESGVRLSWLTWNSLLDNNGIRGATTGVALDSDFVIRRVRLRGNQFDNVETDIVTSGEGEISYERVGSDDGQSGTDEETGSAGGDGQSGTDDETDASSGDGQSGTDGETDPSNGEESSGDETGETDGSDGSDTESDDSESTADGTDESGPGFGVPASLAGLVSAGYFLRRLRESDTGQ